MSSCIPNMSQLCLYPHKESHCNEKRANWPAISREIPPFPACQSTILLPKPQFDKTVTRQSKPVFLAFQGFNHDQFRLCLLVFTVRSVEGCKRLEFHFSLTAKCRVLIANFQRLLT